MHRYDLIEFLGRYDLREHTTLSVLRELESWGLSENGWLAGGAVRDMVHGDDPESDFDLFFRDAACAERFMSCVSQRSDYRAGSVTEFNRSFFITVNEKPRKIQAVTIRFYESLDAVLDSFDYTITQFGIDGTQLVCGPFSLWDLARKRLAVHRVTYGASSVRRMLKYTRRGYTACQGCIVQLLEGMGAAPEMINASVQYVD